jgi:hypothetical protein
MLFRLKYTMNYNKDQSSLDSQLTGILVTLIYLVGLLPLQIKTYPLTRSTTSHPFVALPCIERHSKWNSLRRGGTSLVGNRYDPSSIIFITRGDLDKILFF